MIKDLEYAFSQNDPISFVAMTDGDIVGFTWGYRLPSDKFSFLDGKIRNSASYMAEIAVNGKKRTRGIGSMLGLAFILESERLGMDEVVLRTDENNTASMALFRKLGFLPIPDENSRGSVYDPEYPSRIYLRR